VIEQNPAYGTAQTFNLQDIYSSFLAVCALATPRFTLTGQKQPRRGGSTGQRDEDSDKDHGRLEDDLRDTMIEHLHSEVEAGREESHRRGHIIAGLVVRLPPQIVLPRELPGEPETPRRGGKRLYHRSRP
jgi:hypothetical protein